MSDTLPTELSACWHLAPQRVTTLTLDDVRRNVDWSSELIPSVTQSSSVPVAPAPQPAEASAIDSMPQVIEEDSKSHQPPSAPERNTSPEQVSSPQAQPTQTPATPPQSEVQIEKEITETPNSDARYSKDADKSAATLDAPTADITKVTDESPTAEADCPQPVEIATVVDSEGIEVAETKEDRHDETAIKDSSCYLADERKTRAAEESNPKAVEPLPPTEFPTSAENANVDPEPELAQAELEQTPEAAIEKEVEEPIVSEPIASEPITPAPATPEPATPEPITSESVTSIEKTSATGPAASPRAESTEPQSSLAESITPPRSHSNARPASSESKLPESKSSEKQNSKGAPSRPPQSTMPSTPPTTRKLTPHTSHPREPVVSPNPSQTSAFTQDSPLQSLRSKAFEPGDYNSLLNYVEQLENAIYQLNVEMGQLRSDTPDVADERELLARRLVDLSLENSELKQANQSHPNSFGEDPS